MVFKFINNSKLIFDLVPALTEIHSTTLACYLLANGRKLGKRKFIKLLSRLIS